MLQPLLHMFWGFFADFNPHFCPRLCVSASQDGKLIVWDTITTNKVGEAKGQVYYNSGNRNFCFQLYLNPK